MLPAGDVIPEARALASPIAARAAAPYITLPIPAAAMPVTAVSAVAPAVSRVRVALHVASHVPAPRMPMVAVHITGIGGISSLYVVVRSPFSSAVFRPTSLEEIG